MLLDTTTRTLELVLGSAQTTTAMSIVVDYVETTSTTHLAASSNSASNGTTAVTILSAPAASTQRKVNSLTVYNADSVAKIVTIRLNDNTTLRPFIVVTLSVGDTLSYTDINGYKVTDSMGNVHTAVTDAQISIAAGKTFTVNNSLTLSGTDGTTHTFPATSATVARTDAAQTFTGTQTFSSSPVIPVATAPTHALQATQSSYSPVVSYTGTDSIVLTNVSKLLFYNSVSAGTLTLPTGAVNGDTFNFYNLNTGVLTVARGGTSMLYAQGLSGATSIKLVYGASCSLTFDGTNWLQKSGTPYYYGTTAPTPTAQTGTFNNISCTLSYTVIGKICAYKLQFSSTDIGTAAGYVIVPMPFTAAAVANEAQQGSGVNQSTNIMVSGRITAGSSSMVVFKYDATFPFIANQNVAVSGVYEVA